MATTRIAGARTDFSARDTGVRKVSKQIADAFAKQERQITRLRKQAARTNKTFKTLQGTFKTFASFATGAVFSSIAQSSLAASKETADFGASLVEVSRRLGTTSEDLFALRKAFEGEGIAVSKFDQTMTALIRRFSADSPTLRKAIDKVGISLDEWYGTGGDLAKLLPVISNAMAGTATRADKLNFLQEALSASGRSLIQVLGLGNDNLQKQIALYRKQAEGLNKNAQILKDYAQYLADLKTDEQLSHAKAIAANVEGYKASAKAVSDMKVAFNELGTTLRPAIGLLTEAAGLLAKVGRFIPGTSAREAGERIKAEAEAYTKAHQEFSKAYYTKPKTETPIPKSIYERSPGYMGFSPQNTKQNIDAQKAFLNEQKRLASELQKARETATFGKMDIGLQKAIENQKRLADEAERVNDQIARGRFMVESFASSAVDGFFNAAAGVDSLGESMRRLAADISATIAKQVILNSLFGSTGIAGPTGGGLFESIGKFFGKRESGGPARAGVPYIVGERRPELFVPDSNGTIVPRVPATVGGDTFNIHNTITVGNVPGETTGETEQRLMGAIDRQIKDSFRNIGRASPERLALRRAL